MASTFQLIDLFEEERERERTTRFMYMCTSFIKIPHRFFRPSKFGSTIREQ